MLLEGYKKEMFLPKCNPSFQSVHCVAHVDQNIAEVLPYLNTELGGGDYVRLPPSLTLHIHGKLVTLLPAFVFHVAQVLESRNRLFLSDSSPAAKVYLSFWSQLCLPSGSLQP
jgi:hypothetical protein